MENSYSRITSSERSKIEEMINEGLTLQQIAENLAKAPTSISREVKRNKVKLSRVSKSKFMRNPCEKRAVCKKTNLCNVRWCKRLCAKCEHVFCHDRCDEFVAWLCYRALRWPYVCNRCKWYSTCPCERFAYIGKRADKINDLRASVSRKGLDIDASEIARVDKIISPLLDLGQSPYHIWQNHKGELGFCLSSFYTYINSGLFSKTRMHLLRSVNFRVRKKKKGAKDKRDFTDRTYLDYLMCKGASHDDSL
jgi:IS30 family transposase